MNTVKTSELSGIQLDWAVAKCEGFIDDCNTWMYEGTLQDIAEGSYHPSENWELIGVIIEREKIDLQERGGVWQAVALDRFRATGSTPLIAAARCYVASKIGDEVEIPEIL